MDQDWLIQQQGNETARASLSLLYHISREFAAALDLKTVLERVLFLSMEYTGAITGSIIVLDENGFPIETAYNISGSQALQYTPQLRLTFERGLAGWVARHRQAVLLTDTSQDERWMRRPDDAVDATGPKSVVSAPILARGDQLVGVMTLVHPRPCTFTEEHLELVQAIADQAGIFILNARLYAESQHQTQLMTAVAESAAVITASLELDSVLNRILTQVSAALHAEIASLALIDAQGDQLEFLATTSRQGDRVIGTALPLGSGIPGWVAVAGEGAIIADAARDSRYSAELDARLGSTSRSIACAPIRSQGQVVGILDVRSSLEHAFDPGALVVLNGIGSLAGTAIHHAQLFEQLQAAHQRYRELFEDSIDPIVITDPAGRIQEANRQAELTTGMAGDQLRALSVHDLHALDWERVGLEYEELISGKTVAYEAALRTRSGEKIPVQVNARRVEMDGAHSFQWIFHDITERKELDSMRDDLIAMIYHDLRSPLANVTSSLDVLATILPAEEDSTLSSLLNIAARSTERIQRLTNSLLDINRLEAGQQVAQRQPVEPLSLAGDVIDAVLLTAQSKKITVVNTVSPGLPEVSADLDMIRRVVINLVENAIKFTPLGGKIYLGAQQMESIVEFWVRDTGPGIPDTEKERIFDKFTRLRPKEGPRGLGLGLAFCRLAVTAHGGRIWVDSSSSAGSTFCFTLPLAAENASLENKRT